MRRSLLLLMVMAAALLVPTAQASPPTFIPQQSFSFTDPTTCGFDVNVDVVSGETLRLFSKGNVLVTGPLSATFSGNGKSVTAKIPGPTIGISGHTLLGKGITAGDPILLPDGKVTIAVVAGTVDESVVFPTVLVRGTVLLDVCAALSS